MKSANKLFRLIKALDKNEKGYFKKVASALSQKKTSNYLLLFDAIDKQTEYDEATLLKKFRKTPLAKQLPVIKNYLYELILKSIRLYYSESSQLSKINGMIESADILNEKGLTEQAIELIEKAENFAAENLNTFKILEAHIAKRFRRLDHLSAEEIMAITENIEQVNDCLAVQQRQNHLYELYCRMMEFIRIERNVRNKRQLKYLQQLMTHPSLKGSEKDLSFSAQIHYMMIHKIYYQLINENESAFQYMKQVIDLYQQHPAKIKTHPSRYLSALNNFFSICMKQRKHHLIDEYISKLEPWMLDYDKKSQYKLYEYLIEILFWKGDTEKAVALNQETRAHFFDNTKNSLSNNRKLVLTFNFMYFYHLFERYEEAADMAARLLDMKGLDLRIDIYAATRIFQVIFLYEIEKWSFMESAIRAAKHFLKTRNSYYELEKTILFAIQKLALTADKRKKQRILQELKKNIQQVCQADPLESNFLESCNILPWLHAKLQGGKPLEYVLERYREIAQRHSTAVFSANQ